MRKKLSEAITPASFSDRVRWNHREQRKRERERGREREGGREREREGERESKLSDS